MLFLNLPLVRTSSNTDSHALVSPKLTWFRAVVGQAIARHDVRLKRHGRDGRNTTRPVTETAQKGGGEIILIPNCDLSRSRGCENRDRRITVRPADPSPTPRPISDIWKPALSAAQRSVVEHTLDAFRTVLRRELHDKQTGADRAAALRTAQANLSALLQHADPGAQPVEDMRARATLAACLDAAMCGLAPHV